MGVLDGQAVSAAVSNGAYLDANNDDAALGRLNLQNVLAESGPVVVNIQREFNALASFTGKATGTVYNYLPAWVNNDVGTGSDDLMERSEALTAAFNAASGHNHDGSAGSGGPISLASAVIPLQGWFMQGIDQIGVTGTSTDVSADLPTAVASTGPTATGLVIDAPYNKCIIRKASGGDPDDSFYDADGNLVYARLTKAGPVWTLSYYVDIAGVETAYSFAAPEDVRWYYQELFNPLVNTPVYSQMAVVPSDNTTADVADASASKPGKVSTGIQSFGGAKTFVDGVLVNAISDISSGDGISVVTKDGIASGVSGEIYWKTGDTDSGDVGGYTFELGSTASGNIGDFNVLLTQASGGTSAGVKIRRPGFTVPSENLLTISAYDANFDDFLDQLSITSQGDMILGSYGSGGQGAVVRPFTNNFGFLGAPGYEWRDVFFNHLNQLEAVNGDLGVATLSSGTVTVANSNVDATCRIFVTIQTPNGGTPGAVYVDNIVNNTSFDIKSTSGSDTSIVAWHIIRTA